MHTYIISYDLRGPETSSDYAELIKSIQSLGTWAKPHKSLWLVKCNLTSAEVRNKLQPELDGNDTILVMKASRIWSSVGLSQDVVSWMDEKIS